MKEDSNLSKLDLRNLITPEYTNSRIPWILETPKSIREASVFEAYKNRKSCFSNLKEGNINHFELQFKSKKNLSWTIGGLENLKRLDNYHVSFFPRFNFGCVKTKEKMPEEFQTCSLYFDGLNYYLLVPVYKTFKAHIPNNPCVSLDPGVRTFHTAYSPEEETGYKLGDGADKKLYTLLLSLDRLISKKSKAKKKDYKRLTKEIQKIRIRIQNLQSELHWKLSNWLCSNYKQVIIPKFKTQEMTKKRLRNIRTKTVRSMNVLAHCKFLDRLKTKAEEFGTELVICEEAYTTQECGSCNVRNKNIGSAEEWTCPKCFWTHDRDLNASRNIYIKHFKC